MTNSIQLVKHVFPVQCAHRISKLLFKHNNFESRLTFLYTCHTRHFITLNTHPCGTFAMQSLKRICSNASKSWIEYHPWKFTSSTSQLFYSHKKSVTLCNVPAKNLHFTRFTRNISQTRDKERYPLASSKSANDFASNLVQDRYIYVKTLSSLYEDVTTGIVLDTAYGDSRPNEDFDPSKPVIVALHDTPGTHKDVVPLLEFFARLGCRTICPTFPGHGETRGIMRNFDDIFSQVTMERATFVHDFLDDLGIKRVDVLIGVGAASYTATALCTQMAEVYKSMALISPWPLTHSRIEIKSRILKQVYDLWEMVYFRPLVRLLLPAFKIGNATTTDEKITSCYLAENIDFGEAGGHAITAGLIDIPRLVAYGAKDHLVCQTGYEDLLSKLGINPDQITTEHQELKGKGESSGALIFRDSGYDILNNHRSILCAYIIQLIQKFHPNIKL